LAITAVNFDHEAAGLFDDDSPLFARIQAERRLCLPGTGKAATQRAAVVALVGSGFVVGGIMVAAAACFCCDAAERSRRSGRRIAPFPGAGADPRRVAGRGASAAQERH
jgi:hypothetical protein